ncbi:MAG TPA: hypothetical protein VN937_18175 [Blastocatellia bacterium]|nr:hypothetical protein [Blastocatellia bacterium]
MRRRFPLFAIFILLSAFGLHASSAFAQNTSTIPRSSDNKSRRMHKDDDQDVTLPDDMRIKMAIAREENEYKKTLEDVEKLSGLSEEVAKVYVDRKQLSTDDVKKLNTIEKLAKRVLSHAGGEEVGDKSGSVEHLALAEAIDKLNAAAACIKKEMKAETRFVVSATVVANSNQVISLARLIRHLQKAD